MALNGGNQTLLGRLLLQRGEVTAEEVEDALYIQAETGQPIGEILLQRSAVCGPILEDALAEQRGVELRLEHGFGSGLRAEIERRHWLRRAEAA